MVIVVPASEKDKALAILKASGETAFVVGHIAKTVGDEAQVDLQGL